VTSKDMWRSVALLSGPLLSPLLSLTGCGLSLPEPLSRLPDHVDVFMVEKGKTDQDVYGFIGQEQDREPFTHRVSLAKTGEKSSLQCQRSFSPSKMCEEMEIVCRDKKDRVSSRLNFRQDGLLTVRLGPPWESTPDDLVEVHLIVVEPAAESLYAPGVKVLNAQLTEGIVEVESLTHRSDPAVPRSSWFNQLSVTEEGMYIAIHQSHPHYLQVASALNLVGKLWTANSPAFEDCGFSSR